MQPTNKTTIRFCGYCGHHLRCSLTSFQTHQELCEAYTALKYKHKKKKK